MRPVLTVAEAAQALGTSSQTVRTMLRKGELRGERRPWGSRYVWGVSAEGLDEFLREYGRMDGHRRIPRARISAEDHPGVTGAEAVAEPSATTAWSEPAPVDGLADTATLDQEPLTDQRPLLLRPRGRATAMVIVFGIPLILAYVAAQVLPNALWFRELGQSDVYRRMLVAKLEFRGLVILPGALFLGLNLAMAARGSTFPRPAIRVAIGAVSLAVGGLFASAVAGRWRTFVLWQHRQDFGVVDPVHHRDVGYFVFSLPFELLICDLLLWLVAATAIVVTFILAGRGKVGLRPFRASFDAQLQLAALGAALLVVLACRLHLEQYVLELGQPSPGNGDSFAGADYVDLRVRMPGLGVLIVLAALLAAACLAAPWVSRLRTARTARLLLAVPFALLVVATGLVGLVVPALVQHFAVDPNPLLREQPYLERSIVGTRDGLGLNRVIITPYSPGHRFNAVDFARLTPSLGHVQIWDSWLLGARMRQLVADTPYFRPEDQSLQVIRIRGRTHLNVVSARELDVGAVQGKAGTWINNRLSYTHGLGLVRFSATATDADREPRLTDSGLGIRQPRIYFGNLAGTTSADEDSGPPGTSTPEVRAARSAWVLVDTRRPEVDATTALGSSHPPYHYTGPAGIPVSSGLRRALFAFALGSRQVLLSHDITSSSRILLHRDVHDRLQTLAPFIRWDSSAVPLETHSHLVFVVDGYTTSSSYPYGAAVDLGGMSVSYARASVRATVDAFTGRVRLYLDDPEDPVARAWAAAFPSLFRRADSMPRELRAGLRYPPDLFDAQASAFQRFHTTAPTVFASDSDVWSRPVALSGPIEVAGGVDFDQSDEDNLRLTMRPAYTYAFPPGHRMRRFVLSTYYAPRQGQNLVATLDGWIDRRGRPRLSALSLPRDPVTLGPAQVSRLVFATPRVSNLLGLRNLEIRDIGKSSLDSVILGRPHLLFLPGGVLQIQSLYEGSRGPGAARLLGVTAYINGRAGLGPDIDSAVRQALNQPPRVVVLRPRQPVTVGQAVDLRFEVENAQHETVTVTSPAGRTRAHREVVTGGGAIAWAPPRAGLARVRVAVLGLDGTEVTGTTTVRVLGRPPAVRLLRVPGRSVVGRTVRIPFQILRGHQALATVSTRAGIVLTRRYESDGGRGVLEWRPRSAGTATITVRVRGAQGQTATVSLRLDVRTAHVTSAPPLVDLLHIPRQPTVGVPGRYALRASHCLTAIARIAGEAQDPQVWQFRCPVQHATFAWSPTVAGHYLLTITAHAPGGTTSGRMIRVTVKPTRPAHPSATPSPSASTRRRPPR